MPMDFHQITWELFEDWVASGPFMLERVTAEPPSAIMVQKTVETVDLLIVPLNPPLSIELADALLRGIAIASQGMAIAAGDAR